MSKQKINPKMGLIGAVLFCLIFAGYFYMRSHGDKAQNNITESEANALLTIDLEESYPATPKTVVKLYCRINKCLYNSKSENEDVNKLITMLRELYSEEFLANNPLDKNMKDFKSDIAKYNKDQQKIVSYKIESNEQVKTWTNDGGKECASLVTAFSMTKKSENFKVYERFVLEKDSAGKWKIVGWGLAPETEIK